MSVGLAAGTGSGPVPNILAKVASGSAWLIGGRLITRLVDLLTLLLLARLLGPADFGLVAIAMSLIYIVESVLEMPLVSAIVRLPDVDRTHLDTAFTLGLLRGLALSTLLAACAWPFASFYGDPRLIPLICALSLAPAARGLLNPNLAMDAKAITFWRFFASDCAGKVIAGLIALVIAFATNSYWAIAAYTVSTPVISTLISFGLAPYRPRLCLTAWRDFAGYIGWNGASQILAAINWQYDRLLLGRFVPSVELGRYIMANDIAALPEQALVKPIIGPLMSGFVGTRRDPLRLRSAYLKADTAVFTLGLPVIVGLSAMADPAVRIGLGDKWLPAIPLLHWLALSLIPPLAAAPLWALASALDQPQVSARRSLIESCVRLPLVTLGAFVAGIYGVVATRIASDTIMSLVSMRFVSKLIDLPIRHQLVELSRAAVAGICLYGVVACFQGTFEASSGGGLVLWSLAAVAAGATTYVAALLLLWLLAGRPAGVEAEVIGRLLPRSARR